MTNYQDEDDFESYYSEGDIPSMRPKNKKGLEDDNRCIAVKKNKLQCNVKKYIKGENPQLCHLHNYNGTKRELMDGLLDK